jgi:hypothetical protein
LQTCHDNHSGIRWPRPNAMPLLALFLDFEVSVSANSKLLIAQAVLEQVFRSLIATGES